MFENIHVPLWLTLPKETREHLAKVFGIIPTGVKEVRDQSIVSDGFTNENLMAISKEKMAEYTGSPITESFNRLWEITLSKVRYELSPTPPFDLNSLRTPATPYCDTCTSKSGRHKKGCPKNDK